jgi:hypothetical protein
MKPGEVPDHMTTAALTTAQSLGINPNSIRHIIAAAFTADEDQPTPPGCGCRVHKGEVIVDWVMLNAVPDELVDAFDQGSMEAAHAYTGSSPIGSEGAYVRGGLAAVLPTIATRYEEHLLMLASGYDEIAYDGGMPGASKTGAGSPRALRADARFLRELAKNMSWITGGDR